MKNKVMGVALRGRSPALIAAKLRDIPHFVYQGDADARDFVNAIFAPFARGTVESRPMP